MENVANFVTQSTCSVELWRYWEILLFPPCLSFDCQRICFLLKICICWDAYLWKFIDRTCKDIHISNHILVRGSALSVLRSIHSRHCALLEVPWDPTPVMHCSTLRMFFQMHSVALWSNVTRHSVARYVVLSLRHAIQECDFQRHMDFMISSYAFHAKLQNARENWYKKSFCFCLMRNCCWEFWSIHSLTRGSLMAEESARLSRLWNVLLTLNLYWLLVAGDGEKRSLFFVGDVQNDHFIAIVFNLCCLAWWFIHREVLIVLAGEATGKYSPTFLPVIISFSLNVFQPNVSDCLRCLQRAFLWKFLVFNVSYQLKFKKNDFC